MASALDEGGAGRTIRLSVPGRLEYRDLAIRVVAAACKLLKQPGRLGFAEFESNAAGRDFDHEVISAFGEAFNNVAIHAYRNQPQGTVDIEIELEAERLTLRVRDYGASFNFSDIREPDFSNLPESGWGLYIIRSFMDEVTYSAGNPNVLSISKKYRSSWPRPGESEREGEPEVNGSTAGASDASDTASAASVGTGRPAMSHLGQATHVRGTAR